MLFLEAWYQSVDSDRSKSSLRIPSRYYPRVCGRTLLRELPTGLHRHFHSSADLTFSVPSLAQTLQNRCRNIHLLAIDYDFRPRLRTRLTQGGRTWPWNPWGFGDEDSHLIYRYSRQHTHFQDLHGSSRYRFAGDWNAPLPLVLSSQLR